MDIKLNKVYLKRKCRICGQFSKQFTEIFSNGAALDLKDEETLSLLIYNCLKLKVMEDDDMPKIICNACKQKLTSWYSFYKNCQKTQISLRKDLRVQKVCGNDMQAILKTGSESGEIKIVQNNEDEPIIDFLNSLGLVPKNKYCDSDLKNETVCGSKLKTNSDPKPSILVLKEKESIRIEKNHNEKESEGKLNSEKELAENKIPEILKEKEKDLIDKANFLVEDVLRRGSQDILNSISHKNIKSVKGKKNKRKKLGKKNNENILQPEINAINLDKVKLGSFKLLKNNSNFTKSKNNEIFSSVEDSLSVVKAQILQNVLKDKNIRNEKKFEPQTCHVCDKIFNNLYKWERHQKTHARPEYRCEKCDKVFQKQIYLKCHLETHLECPKYCCHVCGLLFRSVSCLFNHIRHHSNTRPFQCDCCNKEFREKSHLDQHYRIHTGEKPYPCNECSLRFTTVNQFRRHEQAVHRRIKRFKCDVCDKQFHYSPHYKDYCTIICS